MNENNVTKMVPVYYNFAKFESNFRQKTKKNRLFKALPDALKRLKK
jgi:hypothetical protein